MAKSSTAASAQAGSPSDQASSAIAKVSDALTSGQATQTEAESAPVPAASEPVVSLKVSELGMLMSQAVAQALATFAAGNAVATAPAPAAVSAPSPTPSSAPKAPTELAAGQRWFRVRSHLHHDGVAYAPGARVALDKKQSKDLLGHTIEELVAADDDTDD